MIPVYIGRAGSMELLVVLLIVLIVFGPKQIPKLAKGLGETVSGFKKGVEEGLAEGEKTVAGGASITAAEAEAAGKS